MLDLIIIYICTNHDVHLGQIIFRSLKALVKTKRLHGHGTPGGVLPLSKYIKNEDGMESMYFKM